jgi:hypothetical protein
MLDHVECKVIKPAETPNRNPEQHRGPDLRMPMDEMTRTKKGSTRIRYERAMADGAFDVSRRKRAWPAMVMSEFSS